MDAGAASERKAAPIRGLKDPHHGREPVRIVSDLSTGPGGERRVPWWFVCALILGLYLSARGYHSFDGDQAYRLPLLLHRQEPGLYEDDPFVRSLDAFNPHRGSLIVLDAVTRRLGLSAGLFVLFILTFVLTCRAVERLGREVWPELGPNVGWVAVGMLLAAKAGNIGTNHLFEAMVLDRLMAFALGWQAIAHAVSNPEGGWWRPPVAIGLATWIHPSVGLQLAMVLAASWLVWWLIGRGMDVGAGAAVRGLVAVTVAVLPGLAINLPRGSSLSGELPRDVFWLLSVELQSPQHMLPHLWRMPQWLSWSCYFALATLQLVSRFVRRGTRDGQATADRMPAMSWPPARRRLAVSLAIILAGLAVGWFAIEVMHQVRVTIFQPFRMATTARGIAIIIITGRLSSLWRSGRPLGQTRAILLATGFLGDWLLVVVTSAELTVSVVEAIESRLSESRLVRGLKVAAFLGVIAQGLNFLGHHDTESGNRLLLIALVVGLAVVLRGRWIGRVQPRPSRVRLRTSWSLATVMTAAWLIPLAALVAAVVSTDHSSGRNRLLLGLIDRCRFMSVPVDDVERLALWCRENTPRSARFIGPPGPKAFRLWARRSVAFNRAASPYHAAGLADWFARFQDHVDFHATPAEFVRVYLADRHRLESRYQALSDAQRAALAVRQGASYVVAAAPAQASIDNAVARVETVAVPPLELLHVEGRYAVYRVRATELVHRHR
jgi:hypothetical protein